MKKYDLRKAIDIFDYVAECQDPIELDRLSLSHIIDARFAVAENKYTTAETLKRLTADKSAGVISMAILNENLPLEYLEFIESNNGIVLNAIEKRLLKYDDHDIDKHISKVISLFSTSKNENIARLKTLKNIKHLEEICINQLDKLQPFIGVQQ